ncbi:MAG: transpeptidase family protein [Bdellovibrionaceae bacterium]|nr:transpeptidase family protein [Pseudobdellovibrionaceae bacterium]
MGLIAKGIYLQVLPNQRLEEKQKKQFEKIVTLKPRRGVISDRNGKELAVTITSFSLFADPFLVTNPKWAAQKLSSLLNIRYQTVYKKLLNKKRRFVWIKRQLNKELKQKILALKLVGFNFIEEPKRVYPSENVLSQVLGFVGNEGQGLEGLEHFYDEVLSGKTKQLQLRKDARGRPLLINGQLFSEFPDGLQIQLSIDANTQFYLERELQHAIDKHDADSALGVIVDSDSGEIVAMANSPVYNSNHPTHYSSQIRKNRVMLDSYEPGSTLKTFIVSAALKENIIKPNTKFFCENGEYQIGDRVIREADTRHNFGWLTVSEILAQSSNIGSAKIAQKVGAEKYRKFLEDFGFGKKIDVPYGSESKGILQELPWSTHLLSNIAFGHGISVTPLQLVMAYTAIANGGWLLKPLLVKKIYNEMGGEEIEYTPVKVRRVLTESDASMLKLMLMSATAKEATGFSARIKGFPVAGKTGTAQKVDLLKGGYQKGAYLASFAGFVPANAPKYVIYIAVDNPRKEYYGSQVAAPVFSKVASYLVRKEGLQPVLISDIDLINESLDTHKSKKKVVSEWLGDNTPDLKGLTLREVLRKLNGRKIDLDIRGSGRVSSTWPEAGEKLPGNNKIRIQLSFEE